MTRLEKLAKAISDAAERREKLQATFAEQTEQAEYQLSRAKEAGFLGESDLLFWVQGNGTVEIMNRYSRTYITCNLKQLSTIADFYTNMAHDVGPS